MGDFAIQGSDVISQERLQRRLEGYRKHHSSNKIHYDNYANAEYDKIKEDTKVLYQKWLDGKNKKTKTKSTKSETNKETAQMKPKPKVNAVKPIVINPLVPERVTEPGFPASSTNVSLCNEPQKQQNFINTSNSTGNSVQVNINLDANLAQSQNNITVRFSSRITGSNVTTTENNLTNVNVGCMNSSINNHQSCKSESNDLSLSDGTNVIDNAELDTLLGPGPVDDDGPIDFEFFNELVDSNDSFYQLDDSLLPHTTEDGLSPKMSTLITQSVPSSLPSSMSVSNIQDVNMQQKSTFSNQMASNLHLPQNFSRIELNISSDMSKFSSILGETTGPAAETLKHLAAKHNSQEKVQQQMLHNNMMYPIKSFQPRGYYPVTPMQQGNNVFNNTGTGGNTLMSGNPIKHPYASPHCQDMSLECQPVPNLDNLKGKAPPCYQEAKPSSLQRLQIQQPNMQYMGQKPSMMINARVSDMNPDFESCRLSQESQQVSMQAFAATSVIAHGQGMNKGYPNCSQMNSLQFDCLKMQQQKSLMYYQRHHPYAMQGHGGFMSSNTNVPSSFVQNQAENDFHVYKANMFSQQQQQQSYGMLLPQKQLNMAFKQNSVGPVNPTLPVQNMSSTKDAASLDEVKRGATGVNMISSQFHSPMNMPLAEGNPCHQPMNSQNMQSNQEIFYSDNHNAVYPNFVSATPSQLKGKWNNAALPPNHPSTAANKTAMCHMPVNYTDVHHPQNCFPDGRTYNFNGNQSYQFPYGNTMQQNGHYFMPNQDSVRIMHCNRMDTAGASPGVVEHPMGYNHQKRPVQPMLQPGLRMEGFGYNFGRI